MRLFYVHWQPDECLRTVRALRAEGHRVRYAGRTEDGPSTWKALKGSPPDALVVSLDRLPSHGRRVAAVTRESKRLADLPVVFAGGEKEKVATARREFPGATFTSHGRLHATLARLERERGTRPA